MRPFIAEQLDYDLMPVAGLGLVGHYLERLVPVFKQIDAALPVSGGVANRDILRSYLGSLGFCLELALRPGVQHSTTETQYNFERVIPMALRLSAVPAPKHPHGNQKLHSREVAAWADWPKHGANRHADQSSDDDMTLHRPLQCLTESPG